MDNSEILLALASKVFVTPLEKISCSSARPIDKVISAIAIGIFTIFSLGYYAVYAHRFFAAKKLESAKGSLESAADRGDLSTIQKLFAEFPGLKRNMNGEDGKTPCLLHLAVVHDHFSVADYLIQNGASLSAQGRHGTPLDCAVQFGNLQAVTWLLENKKADPNFTQGLWTPFRHAVMMDVKHENVKFQIMEKLLRNGAKPDLEGMSSLMPIVAVNWERNPAETEKIIHLMLEKGAKYDPNDNDSNGILGKMVERYQKATIQK